MWDSIRLLLVLLIFASPCFPKGMAAHQVRHDSARRIFKREVDPTLITPNFSFKKLGAVRVTNHLVQVYLYESTFGEAQRMTRRIVFISNTGGFLGMYGNFPESPLSIKDNRIKFEADPSNKGEADMSIPFSEIPSRITFRGEEYQLFGKREK